MKHGGCCTERESVGHPQQKFAACRGDHVDIQIRTRDLIDIDELTGVQKLQAELTQAARRNQLSCCRFFVRVR